MLWNFASIPRVLAESFQILVFRAFDDSEPVQRILIAKVSDLNGIIEYLIIPVVFNVNKSF